MALGVDHSGAPGHARAGLVMIRDDQIYAARSSCLRLIESPDSAIGGDKERHSVVCGLLDRLDAQAVTFNETVGYVIVNIRASGTEH